MAFRVASTLAVVLGLITSLAPRARADEGQWPPNQVRELDWEKLEKLGLKLPPEALYSDDGGLMRAAVNYGGCTAAFVSPDGLLATNHHCAYSAVQAQSSVEHNYLGKGFLARTRAEELEAKGRSTITVLLRITDVTAQVHAAAAEAKDEVARKKAVEKTEKALVEACEKAAVGRRCQVASFHLGTVYRLFETFEVRDVRIVYAPPSAVGEYGGDIDNWMWPRHTGDFALLRAYVGPEGQPAAFAAENVPYRPKEWLRVSAQGVKPGDFVAVLGYPGHTDRYLPAPEVRRQVEQVLPATVDLYGEWIALLEAASARSPAVAIKVAALKKSLANRHKNARGMLTGIARMGLLERRVAEDAALAEWAAQRGEPYPAALAALAALTEKQRAEYPRELLHAAFTRGPSLTGAAIDLVRRAREWKKPDLERESAYMLRNEDLLRRAMERRLRDFDPEVEAALLASLFVRAAEVGALKGLATSNRARALATARRLVKRSRLARPGVAAGFFQTPDEAKLVKSKDPLLVLAMQLADALEASERGAEARQGALLQHGPRYFEMLAAVRKGPVYPDANGTLRLSYATVKGYAPRDGLVAVPQTTLAGAVEKHTGAAPFNLPEPIRAAAPDAKKTRWADAGLSDVPICFLTNADTTGGNSGSPAIDGQGRLVGLNFDRVWENIAGDFSYNPPLSRNVVVDVRYLLWLLDEVHGATPLLEELLSPAK